MAQSNVSMFTASGMLNPAKLTSAETDFLNSLTTEEAGQLVAMWNRLGQPDLPSDGDHVGFF